MLIEANGIKIKTMRWLVFTFSVVLMALGGCTTKAWYEGTKQGAENNCRSQPPAEIDRCLENLNKKTYEEYEKDR